MQQSQVEMECFNSNARFLPQEITRSLPPPSPIENARSGEPAAKIGGAAIVSTIDPRAEGATFASTAANATHVMVYGIGLGYHLEALLALPAVKRLVLIEANPELLSTALHARDLSAVLGDERVTLIHHPSEGEMVKFLSRAIAGEAEFTLLIHQASFRLLPAPFGQLRGIFETIQSERRYAAFFREQERRNILANIPAIAGSPGVARLFALFKGKPAVVVGAGPSLDRALPMLEWLQGKAYVIAVDTALEVLDRNGIRCHAVISVDPQPLSAFHLTGVTDIPLLFIPTTHPAVVEMFQGNRYLMVKEGHPFFGKAEPLVRYKGTSPAGGSVSCFALDMLARAGAGPLFFAGQDFAYTQGLPYNRGTLAGYAPEGSLAGGVAEGSFDHLVGGAQPVTIMLEGGFAGETRGNLRGYLRTFEEIIGAFSGTRFFNLDSRGAAVRGGSNIVSAGGLGRTLTSFGPIGPLPTGREQPDPSLEGKLRASVAE